MATDNHTATEITFQTSTYNTIVISLVDVDLIQTKWHVIHNGYARCSVYHPSTQKQTRHLMHRIILERMLGRPLNSVEYADHINGNRLDNRRENLRLASKIQNGRNAKQRIDNQSGFKGVSYLPRNNKWRARIRVDKKEIHLGVFDTKESAFSAYSEAALKYFGEFARLK